MLQTILTILILALSFPTGFGLAQITRYEKEIYKKYFPPILWVIAIATAISYNVDKTAALTLTFIFLTIFTWNKI